MGDIPGSYDRERARRQLYLRYLALNLLLIIIGLSFILTLAVWKVIMIVLLVPTAIGGYAMGGYFRNYLMEILTDRGYEHEDADFFSLICAVGGGLLGTLALAAVQAIFILVLFRFGLFS